MPTIARLPLTKVRIETAKPAVDPYYLRDATVPGLALRIFPTGRKTYSVLHGRGMAKTIGDHPVMTLDGARDTAKRVLAEIAEHGAPLSAIAAQAGKPMTLGQFVTNHYGPWVEAERRSGTITRDRILSVFHKLLNHSLDGIQVIHLDAWKAERLKSGIEPTTINRDLTALKAALSKAVEWKKITSAPAVAVKKAEVNDDKRVRYLSPAENKRLRKALADRDAAMRAARKRTIAAKRKQHRDVTPLPDDGFGDLLTPLVMTALNTGCRRSELTGLAWADVDLKDKKQILVRAYTSKRAKPRYVPLNAEAIDILKRWKRQSDNDRVFPIESPKKAWGALMIRAKIEDFTFHDCRHDFASRLVMAGVPLAVIRDLLGHASIVMTERYAHLAETAGAAAVAKLGAR